MVEIPFEIVGEICTWLRYDLAPQADKKARIAALRVCRLVNTTWHEATTVAFSDSTLMLLPNLHATSQALTHKPFLSTARHARFMPTSTFCAKSSCMSELLKLLKRMSALRDVEIHLGCQCAANWDDVTFKSSSLKQAWFYFCYSSDQVLNNLSALLQLMPSLKILALYRLSPDPENTVIPLRPRAQVLLPALEAFEREDLYFDPAEDDRLSDLISIDSFRNVTEIWLDRPSLLRAESKDQAMQDMLAGQLERLNVYSINLSADNGLDFRPFSLAMIQGFRNLKFLNIGDVFWLDDLLQQTHLLSKSLQELCIRCSPVTMARIALTDQVDPDLRLLLRKTTLKVLTISSWDIDEWGELRHWEDRPDSWTDQDDFQERADEVFKMFVKKLGRFGVSVSFGE